MDIEKLIEQLRDKGCEDCPHRDTCRDDDTAECVIRLNAATVLSTLQAENEKLRAELNDLKSQWDMYGGDVGITAVYKELEQVKAERDAAVSWAQKYTESIDRPCVACKHNTGDYVCTAICGNCGPMGAESCKWEFDFSGELKED